VPRERKVEEARTLQVTSLQQTLSAAKPGGWDRNREEELRDARDTGTVRQERKGPDRSDRVTAGGPFTGENNPSLARNGGSLGGASQERDAGKPVFVTGRPGCGFIPARKRRW